MSDQNSDPSRPFDPPVPPTSPPTAPPAPPEAPPAPPTPSAPSEPLRPDLPQYGEYAPAAASNPYGVPATGGPAYGAPTYAPLVRKRRTWDIVLTSILLFLGLLGMGAGLAYAAIFANPEVLDQAMESQGYGGFTGNPGAAPAVLAISHVVLFLLALGLSIPLLIRGKIVVFWIPLAIGVVAAIIFWVVVFNVITSDPGFLSQYGG